MDWIMGNFLRHLLYFMDVDVFMNGKGFNFWGPCRNLQELIDVDVDILTGTH